MTDTWMLYYAITVFLMTGCGYMCYTAGRREGVIRFLSFLEEKADSKGIVKVRISPTDFEVLK